MAGLIKRAVNGDAARKSCLVGWLTSSTGAGLGEGIAVRRTVVAAIGENKDDVLGIVEGALALFGDELYIRHSPALQQEGWLASATSTYYSYPFSVSIGQR